VKGENAAWPFVNSNVRHLMKRSLQVVVAVLSVLPLTFGVLGVLFGAERFLPGTVVPANLDSQFRFLSAWYIGLAVIAWWMIPRIEDHKTLFRIVCVSVFVGGLARLVAWSFTGAPDIRFLVVLSAELLFPILIPWQARVAQLHANSVRG
jgi:hypothetical protein